MTTTKRSAIAAAILAVAAGCQMPSRGGESYSLSGDPWAAKAEDGGAGAAEANAGPATPQAGAAASKESRSTTGATVLEQLEEARARVKALEAENQQLRTDGASLTALLEQLREQNANLAQLADASVQSRAAVDQELEKRRQEAKDLEARCRALADDLLAERIQRVRVERELILAKVKEAETRDDGP